MTKISSKIIRNLICDMVKDKFGNYVVQKMIEAADTKNRDRLVKKILSYYSNKKRDGFGEILSS